MRSMHTRHLNGLLELELADWKVSRVFRIMAFDAGLLTFKDIKFSRSNENQVYILITNPKNALYKTTHYREPLKRMAQSTHIRLLIFSQKATVKSVQVFVNDLSIGFAVQKTLGSPLYTMKWRAQDYLRGIHRMKVVVKDAEGRVYLETQEFALDDSVKSFKLFPTLLLRGDQIELVSSLSLSLSLSLFLFYHFH